jgi:protein SCO1/2
VKSPLRRAWPLLLGLLVLAALVPIADYLIQLQRSEGRIPPGTERRISGRFDLVNQHGNPVSETDFADRHKLVFFGFTHCPDVCPVTLARMSVVLRLLGPAAERLYPLFITVDPERDTPERLRQYSGPFDPRITYLTGTPQQVTEVLDSWWVTRARVAAGAGDYSMEHSAVLYLLSPEGVVIESFRWDLTEAELVRALEARL